MPAVRSLRHVKACGASTGGSLAPSMLLPLTTTAFPQHQDPFRFTYPLQTGLLVPSSTPPLMWHTVSSYLKHEALSLWLAARILQVSTVRSLPRQHLLVGFLPQSSLATMQASRLCSANHISAAHMICQRPCTLRGPAVVPARRLHVAAAARQQQAASSSSGQRSQQPERPAAPATLAQLAALWGAVAALPANAAELSGGPPASSYYVSLGLFLMTVPGGQDVLEPTLYRGSLLRSERWVLNRRSSPPAGLWSLIKRAPKAKIKRKTYEVAGPADVSAWEAGRRARRTPVGRSGGPSPHMAAAKSCPALPGPPHRPLQPRQH